MGKSECGYVGRRVSAYWPGIVNLSLLPYRPQLIHSGLQPNRLPDPRCSKIRIEDPPNNPRSTSRDPG